MKIASVTILVSLLTSHSAMAAGDPARGGKLFIQCQACHSRIAGEPNRIGPNLSGIFDARAATRPKYAYSPAMTKSGIKWDAKSLDAFLTKPSARVPGSKMAFAGIAVPQSRADIIAYLATLK